MGLAIRRCMGSEGRCLVDWGDAMHIVSMRKVNKRAQNKLQSLATSTNSDTRCAHDGRSLRARSESFPIQV